MELDTTLQHLVTFLKMNKAAKVHMYPFETLISLWRYLTGLKGSFETSPWSGRVWALNTT